MNECMTPHPITQLVSVTLVITLRQLSLLLSLYSPVLLTFFEVNHCPDLLQTMRGYSFGRPLLSLFVGDYPYYSWNYGKICEFLGKFLKIFSKINH